MKKASFNTALARSQKIREMYHQLELKHHGSKWTVEEDALAFLTDAGLVGRLTMAQQGRRRPIEKEAAPDLKHKLGECIWWLIVLAERVEIDAESALEVFLTKTEQQLKGSLLTAQGRTKEAGASQEKHHCWRHREEPGVRASVFSQTPEEIGKDRHGLRQGRLQRYGEKQDPRSSV